ncbi:MAG: hypothetical protein Q9209_006776 [Squamulea sp. 1 TL-2023]
MKRKRRTSDDSGPQPHPAKLHPQHRSHVNLPTPTHPTSEPAESARSNDRTNSKRNNVPSYEDQTDRVDWQHAHSTDRSTQPEITRPTLERPSRPPSNLQTNVMVARSSATNLQETIETDFSMKILLKHRELRFIDQEIAKCQIALEQLRRCQVIPYPAMSSSWEEMRAVAGGTGPIQSNGAANQNVSPWGVTNGPYTRHYRHWLVPDAVFGDPVTEEMPISHPSRTGSVRSVRASTAGKSSLANQSRSQRGQSSARLKALPHGYPEAKEDKGPMIVKRSSDGRTVKLVCLDCQRLDFNSVQGFINHCRIAHSRNFQSHDAAAIACGQEVELDQAGRLVGESGTVGNSTGGLVHPLITAEIPKPKPSTGVANDPCKFLPVASFDSQSFSQSSAAAGSNNYFFPQTQVSGVPDTSGYASTPFQASRQTPYLSTLLAKRGGGIDLEEEVNLAMTKYDIDADVLSDDGEDDDVEAEDTEAVCSLGRPVNYSTRGVVRPAHPPSRATMAPISAQRSPSVKPALRKPKDLPDLSSQLTKPTPTQFRRVGLANDGVIPLDHDTLDHDEAPSPNLSPNTAESHQAPSLISDDDDVENTHSECSSTADVAEDLERHYFRMDFESHDHQVVEDLEGASDSAETSDLGISAKFKGSHPPRRSSAMRSPDSIHNTTINNMERHVSFASPMQRPRKKGTK